MSFINENKLLRKVRKALEKYGYGDDIVKASAAEHIIDDQWAISRIIDEIYDEEVSVSTAVKHAVEAEEENIIYNY